MTTASALTAILSLPHLLHSNEGDLKTWHKWNGGDEKPHGDFSFQSLPSCCEAQEGEAYLEVLEIAFVECTVYKDGRHERFPKVKGKHLDRPWWWAAV